MKRRVHGTRTLVAALVIFVGIGVSITSTGATNATSPLAKLWVEPAAGYGFLDSAVNSAHHSIELSMYELKDPVMESALAGAARRGLRVRVLLNADYLGRSENASAAQYLSRRGVHVTWAAAHTIFHAKYLLVDATRAYIGSGNFVAYDYPNTRDFWVLDTSPQDLVAIRAVFTSDLHGTSNTVSPSNGLVWSPGSEPALLRLIASARHTLLIENEEMYSYGIEDALVAAAQRGVAVTVVMTAQARYYSDLTYLAQHGIHVRLLTSAQLYIHAKAICVDCVGTSGTAFVGSINYSTSSLSYNRELGVSSSTPSVVSLLRSTIEGDAGRGAPLQA